MWTIAYFLAFIYSIILHEIAHGLAADKLGDPTARLSNRLTLNPKNHIDPLMSVIVPLFLFLSGSPVLFGAAKPVPIDPYNLQKPKKDMGLIALAGPATNLLIAVIFGLIARVLIPLPIGHEVFGFLAKVIMLNLFLALFNLIPIPPLDGGRVLASLLPNQYADALNSLERYGIFVVFFLFMFPGSFLSLPNFIYSIASTLFSLIVTGLPIV